MPIISTPLPRGDFSHFFESCPQRSPRDSQATGTQWMKNGQTTDQTRQVQNSLSATNRMVQRMRPRIIGMPQNPQLDFLFPFNIYPIENNTATAAQRKVFADLNLSINDFTFQIASGAVGARSYINNPVGQQALNLFYTFDPIGNFEQQLFCPCTDSQNQTYPPPSPESNAGTCVILDNVNPTLIFGIPSGSPINTPPTAYNQVALNQINNDTSLPSLANWFAVFWLEIIDDPLNGIYVNLMGQMFGANAPRVAQPFPSGSNIIVLGMGLRGFVEISEQIETTVIQMQTGNLINRFPPTLANERGLWTEIFAALPSGKTHLVFYPGDIVTDDTVTNSYDSGSPTAGEFYGKYIMTGSAPIFTIVANNPLGDSANWTINGMYPV